MREYDEKKYYVGNIVIDLEYTEDLDNTIECMEKYLHYDSKYSLNIIAEYYISLKLGDPKNIIGKDYCTFNPKEIVVYSDSKNKVKDIVKYFEYDDKQYFIGKYFSLKKYKSDIEMIILKENFNLERMLLRVIRELLLRENENDNSTLFHGAFLNMLDKGIILPGDKGFGKTTLICKLLEYRNSKFLTNDKLLIKNNLDVIYIPLSIRIAPGTIKGNDKIKNYLNNNKLIRKENDNIIVDDSKYAFTSYEISKVFGCNLISNSIIDVIIIPQISENNKAYITRLDYLSAKKFLEPCILTPNDIMWPNNWLIGKTNSNEDMIENSNVILEKLLKKPCFLLNYGYATSSEELFEIIGGCFE